MVKVKISDWKADSSMDEAIRHFVQTFNFAGADKKVIALQAVPRMKERVM